MNKFKTEKIRAERQLSYPVNQLYFNTLNIKRYIYKQKRT